MADSTGIEWTDATWNPVTGCSKVSPGCAHCYAERISIRFGRSAEPWTPENAAENVVLHADRLDQPSRWRRPRMVFVNSMSDLFHELVPDQFISHVFESMAAASQHTFQVLTKRPERAQEWLRRHACDDSRHLRVPLPNVWLGVSIENARFTWRANVLRKIPAAVRFISAEPLLGSLFDDKPCPHCLGGGAELALGVSCPKCGGDGLRVRPLDLTGIDWLIAGGESGAHARPMQLLWARELRDACRRTGVAFFFKQWGGRTPKAGGRELDGETFDEMPRAAAS